MYEKFGKGEDASDEQADLYYPYVVLSEGRLQPRQLVDLEVNQLGMFAIELHLSGQAQ